ncbi:MAG: hypothetical protein ACKVHE_23105 [Planctomycetales bacterium]|jgi:hypothetical protein
MKWPLSLESGKYRLRSLQLPHAINVSVVDGVGERRWDVEFGSGTSSKPPALSAGQ